MQEAIKLKGDFQPKETRLSMINQDNFERADLSRWVQSNMEYIMYNLEHLSMNIFTGGCNLHITDLLCTLPLPTNSAFYRLSSKK